MVTQLHRVFPILLVSILVLGGLQGAGAETAPATTTPYQIEAKYPVTINQLIFLEQKVIAPDGEEADWFGNPVAISGDTAIVGALADHIGANGEQGSAYVFTRIGTNWELQQKLTASDGDEGDRFGSSVAIYGDTALVGAPTDIVDGTEWQGSAYVFTRNGTCWSEQAHLTAPDGAWRDYFGNSVALAGDRAIVGAHNDDIETNGDQGSAYIFTGSGSNWSLQQKLTAPDGAVSDHFGNSVTLSGDTALIGSHEDDIGANANQGSAYIFTRNGTSWSLQQKLTASDGAAEDHFGFSVAISGETTLLGASVDDIDANNNQGSAYIFIRSGTTWSLQQKLIAPDGAALDIFGCSVAVSGDTALVGAHLDDVTANNNQGSAYIFTRSGTIWDLQQKLVGSDGAVGDDFGLSTAISGDTALVGAAWDDVGTNANQGSVYFYQLLSAIYLPLVVREAP